MIAPSSELMQADNSRTVHCFLAQELPSSSRQQLKRNLTWAAMNISNIQIIRVIVHEVVRASKIPESPPILNDELIQLDANGIELVGKRLVAMVASGSHCVDVTVDESSSGSPFDHATRMLDAKDDEFVASSKHLAQALSNAQTAGSIRAGSAIFVQGGSLIDGESRRFLSIIKADPDQALVKRVRGDSISLAYVGDTLLGESQRLLKIAFFIEDENATGKSRNPSEFSVRVFDHLMQNKGEGDAAIYFYRTFLRCSLAHNASRQTKEFYELARRYISILPISDSERLELHGDLISYLRGNRAVLEPRTFAKEVLPTIHQDRFLMSCKEAGMTKAISKDLELLKGKLRRQSIRFSSNVTLYAPPEVFRDSVKVLSISSDGWTNLKIKGSIEELP